MPDNTEGELVGHSEHLAGSEVKTGVAWVGTRLKEVQFTVLEGNAIVEGCIVLGKEEEVEQLTRAVEEAKRRAINVGRRAGPRSDGSLCAQGSPSLLFHPPRATAVHS